MEKSKNMKSFTRNALLGAAGLVAMSLSANAAGSTVVADTPLFKSNAEIVKQMQLAQRPYDPSAGSVGFKKAQYYGTSSAASASRSRSSIHPECKRRWWALAAPFALNRHLWNRF